MIFKYPHFLWGLVLVPLIFYLLTMGERKGSTLSSVFGLFPSRRTFRIQLLLFSRFVLAASFGLFIVAFARPQKGYIEETLHTEGIDIVLCIDISSSMKAEDFKPNRLGAAKIVARDFIEGRDTDRIGLVVFSRKAVTQSPLTIDYSILYNFIETIEIGMIADGTAIGNAISESAKRLIGGEEESKVLILLTDGINNSGEIDPITAASAAQSLDIKIYTIGVGSMGSAPYPVDDSIFGKRYVQVPVQIDEDTLERIAGITGGRYFRATDTETLEEIYREIDLLEKSKIEIEQYKRTREWFSIPLALGLFLIVMNLAVQKIVLRTIP
jgi:Ca-activated chloride channel family protein